MCKWGNNLVIPISSLVHPLNRYANPNWIKYHRGIPVDACIKHEVEYLIEQGVITLGCCCGHGKSKYATCLIHKDSVDLIKELGYEYYKFRPNEDGFENLYEIKLMTKVVINYV